MRKILLTCVATLGAGATIAHAQIEVVGAPTQGQSAWMPSAQSLEIANDNNNAQAAMRPGVLANPTPGSIVIHIGGRVNTGFKAIWSSADQRIATAPAGGSLGALLGNNGAGPVKLAPDALYSYARIYLGADAMATNGLRYGAAIEVRQNFTGQISNNSSSGASGYSSLETLFVRRAFTYAAGDQWGILRAGQADGLISLFDNGITTFQFLPTNNLQNGDDFASLVPTNATVPFFFLSGAGNEYTNAKLVYLSPQVSAVDFGIQYAPNTSNGNGISSANIAPLVGSLNGSGTGTGNSCAVANTGCPTLFSGPGVEDGSRILNQTAIGARYQGTLGGVGGLAYAVYEFSGHANYTGATTAAVLGNSVAGSRFNGQYDALSFGNGGLALTYAGFTIGGNVIGGRLNGQLALAPQHAVGELAYMFGAKYVIGPVTVGVSAERGYYQGNVNLTGITQRRGQAIDFGASYAVAPGFVVLAEYQYQTLYQGSFNFITGSIGSNANNTISSQGFLVGNVVNF